MDEYVIQLPLCFKSSPDPAEQAWNDCDSCPARVECLEEKEEDNVLQYMQTLD